MSNDVIESTLGEGAQQTQFASNPNSKTGIVGFAAVLAQEWKKWLPISIGFGLLGLITVLLIPPRYKAEAVLTVVPDSNKSGQAVLSQISGLADLAGVASSTSDNKAETLATLTSRALIMQYIEEKNLLPLLFARKWDVGRSKWKSAKIPTPWEGWYYFQHKLYEVKDNKKAGTITVSVEWTSPQLAATWANDLVKRANDRIRERVIKSSEENLKYLKAQLAQSPQVEMQELIYRLTENELKQAMIASGTEEYALRVIDPAYPPENRIWPSVSSVVLGFVVFGFVVSSFLVKNIRKAFFILITFAPR